MINMKELREMSVEELAHFRRHISYLITTTRSAAIAASFPRVEIVYDEGPRGDTRETTVEGSLVKLSGSNIVLTDARTKRQVWITLSRIIAINGQSIPRDSEITPAHFNIH